MSWRHLFQSHGDFGGSPAGTTDNSGALQCPVAALTRYKSRRDGRKGGAGSAQTAVKLILVTFCLGLMMAATVPAVADTSAPAHSYALLVGGLGGQEPYTHWYEDWLGRFQKYLTGPANVPRRQRDHAGRHCGDHGGGDWGAGQAGAGDSAAGSVYPLSCGPWAMNGINPTLMLPGAGSYCGSIVRSSLAGIASKNQVVVEF